MGMQDPRPWAVWAHKLGPIWSHLGPWAVRGQWRPEADILEAEGRLNGGLGAEPPGKKPYKKSREGPTQAQAWDWPGSGILGKDRAQTWAWDRHCPH